MTTQPTSQPSPSRQPRRSFLKTALAASMAPFALRAQSQPNTPPTPDTTGPKLKLGLIGCGGRGNWIAKRFLEHGGYEFTAAADYFQDRLDAFSADFNIPPTRCFSGLSGYQKLIDAGNIDAVVIQSPPFFHPEQAAAAVGAGLHVYLAKPIAVDVPGSTSIETSGQQATQKGLTFLVDFQTRADPFFIEAIKRVHDGALGEFSFGEALYHAGNPFQQAAEILQPDPADPERRLRAWGVDQTLSGDIITEQNIHTLDVMSWIMNTPPLEAIGSCNQKARAWGDCHDHFSVIFRYPNSVDVSFTSRQFDAHGSKPDGIRNRMFGTKGVLETQYSGPVLLRGGAENFYRGGNTQGLYTSGAVTNIAAFHDAVASGDASNPTVAPSVRSNLVTLLGREAAYTGKTVTWKKLLAKRKPLKLDLELKS